MSPGSHMRALTAIRAKKNMAIIKAGNTVVLKSPKVRSFLIVSYTRNFSEPTHAILALLKHLTKYIKDDPATKRHIQPVSS